MAHARLSSTVSRLRRRIGVALVLVAALTVPATAAGAVAGDASGVRAAGSCGRRCLSRDLRADLTAYLAARASAERISAAGLSVRLPRGRGTLDLGAGTMRIGGTRPVGGNAVWQIGSNTKAFTSVILLQLEAERRLSITDTVGRWLPGYRQWRRVTIARLLNMTSGIPSYDNTRAFLHAFSAHPHRHFTARELVDYARTGKPTHGYSYSNTNYVLAEMIVEKVTHDHYAHQLRSRVIRPLHLRDLYYRPDRYPAGVTRREPSGYFANRADPGLRRLLGRDVSRTTLSWARGAGGILATTHDMTVWENALYRGRLLPPAQQAELRSLVSARTGRPIRHTTPSDPQGFGLGIAQLTDPAVGRVWFYEGETLAFRALHVYFPRSGLIFAVALNSQPTVDGIGELVGSVYGTLLADGAVPGARSAATDVGRRLASELHSCAAERCG
jgi:D-alanyl-D-alanine carboxypeptidase